MKKLFLLFVMVFALQAQTILNAQDEETINFVANLGQVFDLKVTDDPNQVADFVTADDYNFGVTPGAGITDGINTVTMEATGNWKLEISAPNFSDGGTQSIPINNLGVSVLATGLHQIGQEVICPYVAGNPLGLSTGVQLLIDNGTGNSGDATDNAFELHWEMGTMDGTMNPLSMFDQMAQNLFGIGNYSTVVTLTMTALP